jgi:hypothetical protein
MRRRVPRWPLVVNLSCWDALDQRPLTALHPPSLPGLTRQSIDFRKDFFANGMDARVISAFTRVFRRAMPAHDESRTIGSLR